MRHLIRKQRANQTLEAMWPKGDVAICGACSILNGLQGFLPHLFGHVGGHQHVAELALSKTALTLVSNKRIKKAGCALPAYEFPQPSSLESAQQCVKKI